MVELEQFALQNFKFSINDRYTVEGNDICYSGKDVYQNTSLHLHKNINMLRLSPAAFYLA